MKETSWVLTSPLNDHTSKVVSTKRRHSWVDRF